MIFEGVDEQVLAQYGEVATPSLEDLFVAMNQVNTVVTGQER